MALFGKAGFRRGGMKELIRLPPSWDFPIADGEP